MEQPIPKFQIGDEVETNSLYKTMGETAISVFGESLDRKTYRCGKVTDIQIRNIHFPMMPFARLSLDGKPVYDIHSPTKWIERTLVMIALDDSGDPVDMLGQDLLQKKESNIMDNTLPDEEISFCQTLRYSEEIDKLGKINDKEKDVI